MPVFSAPQPDLTFAVGDVHGHAGQLAALLDVLAQHAGDTPHRIVFLGDLVDKGPASAAVLERVMGLMEREPGRVYCVSGNHDFALASSIRDPRTEPKWMRMGGEAVLAEYGVAHATDLPPQVRSWVTGLPTWYDDGSRHFVHAGVDPALPLDAQTDEIRMSMRGNFLSEDHDLGRHIVHGHTPQMDARPTLRPFRTNLDTGIYQTGVLTAAAFSRGEPRPAVILQVSAQGALQPIVLGAQHA